MTYASFATFSLPLSLLGNCIRQGELLHVDTSACLSRPLDRANTGFDPTGVSQLRPEPGSELERILERETKLGRVVYEDEAGSIVDSWGHGHKLVDIFSHLEEQVGMRFDRSEFPAAKIEASDWKWDGDRCLARDLLGSALHHSSCRGDIHDGKVVITPQ